VMARVNQVQGQKEKPRAKQLPIAALWWRRHPAWVVAVAAILLFAFAWGGYELSEYRHGEEIRMARENQQRMEEAERARDQALRALEIARSKLNHVLEHAQFAVDVNDRTRRQRL